MAKTKKTTDVASDDLLGGTPAADDLLDGAAKPKPAKAKPAAKGAAKPAAKGAAKPAATPAEKPAKAAKPAKVAKPAATGAARGVRGTGKFYIDPDEFAGLQKKISGLKKPASSREIAEKFETDTWKARLAAAALVKAGKGSLDKVGSTLTFTPA